MIIDCFDLSQYSGGYSELIILMKLKMQGYMVLRSNNLLTGENPTWIPEKVDMEKFFDLDSKWIANSSILLQEFHLLVIDDALYNINNKELFVMFCWFRCVSLLICFKCLFFFIGFK